MREVLEDAAVVYRHEAESLLIVAAPAVVLGPVCVLIAASGLRAAIAIIPVMMVVYLLTYAASLRAAKLVLTSDEPDPTVVFVESLSRLPSAIIAFAPIALLLAATSASALIVSDQGYPLIAFGVGLLGAFTALAWMARHTYDLPLVLGYGIGGFEALRAGRNVLAMAPSWTARIFVATGLPLIVAWLLSWGLWAALAPAFGAAVFAAFAALWLPFAALCLVGACTQIVSEDAAIETAAPA